MSSGAVSTRHSILKAARELLEQRASQGVRLEDVARAAGVSRQTVYLHFGSRKGLLVALVDYVDETERLAEMIRPVREAPSGAAALDAWVDLHAAYTPRIHSIARALESMRLVDSSAAEAWDDRMSNRRATARRIILQLSSEGNLVDEWDIDDAADLLWELTSVRTWEDLVLYCGWPQERYKRHMRGVLRRIFLRGTEHSSTR
ncbi:MAG: TetR/AcrR family transcriptional regulator [Chloroflexota bacterium]